MANKIWTLVENIKVALQQKASPLVGVTDQDGGEPVLLRLNLDGSIPIVTTGSFDIAGFDYTEIEYWPKLGGGDTNNPHYVRYRSGGASGTLVATLTLTYVNGGGVDNDVLLSVEKT